MRGHIEHADRLGVTGWALGGRLTVWVNGQAIETVAADRYRADLADIAGAGAFEVWFPPLPDTAADIAVTSADGMHLPGSPIRFPPAISPAMGERLPDTGAPLALVVDEAAPDSARDAGSVALLSHMAALRRLGFSVVFATLAEAAEAIRRTAGRVRVAYLHRLRPMALARAIRAANPGVHVVFAVADLAHLRAEREASVLGTVPPAGLRAAELAAAQAADAVVTHSRVEAALLERLGVRRAHAVPWAVAARPVPVPFGQRPGIGFLGSYGHPPNVDAARMLLENIMPAVWASAPIPLVLAGHGMPRWLRARAGGPVQTLADVPDTADLWRRVRVAVAPLRFGAGVKGKVLDSLAAGIPCVCSPVAAEGLALPPATIAPDIPAMVAALLRLHADAAANAAAASAGFALLADGHTPARVDQALAWALA